MLAVCHVLRYAPQSCKIKKLIDDGVIGDVVNIQLLEPVSFSCILIQQVFEHIESRNGPDQSVLYLELYI